MAFDIIVCCDPRRGIGKEGGIPWMGQVPEDLQFFRELTIGARNNAVLMGRKTWGSIPEKYRPLKDRTNGVLTRESTEKVVSEGANAFDDFGKALAMWDTYFDAIFVMGGGELYAEALRHPDCHGLYITRLGKEFECDTFFPDWKREGFIERYTKKSGTSKKSGIEYTIDYWIRP